MVKFAAAHLPSVAHCHPFSAIQTARPTLNGLAAYSVRVTAKPRKSTSSEIHTDTTHPPARPTGTFTLGPLSVKARGPKMRSWLETANLIERVERANAAQAALERGGITSQFERRDLEREVREAPTTRDIHLALIEGEHGFLRKALSAEDFDAAIALIADDDSELDIPELYDETMRLFLEFAPFYSARADAVGLSVPDLQARARAAEAAEAAED
jgi:hypothetical protein